ncbi:MAG: LysM peptidoglycan-binding domain-containing protein [Nitrososphaerota archaeon]|nr:LysM peptidoglycan-binding domain-containing protein [Nitrososphaerota archaeon]
MSTYEKVKRPDKKADNSNGCSSFEVSELLEPQQTNLEQGHFTYNFCDLPIYDPTTVASEGGALISQSGNPGDGEALCDKIRAKTENELHHNFAKPPQFSLKPVEAQSFLPSNANVENACYTEELDKASITPQSNPYSGKPLHVSNALAKDVKESFGITVSELALRESPEVAKMGAKAAAQGNVIRFAPGEFNPDTRGGLCILGHELAHVREQAQGGVRANVEGTNIYYDQGHEAKSARAGEAFADGVLTNATPMSLGGISALDAPVSFAEAVNVRSTCASVDRNTEYDVQSGDTLESIAQNIYGDAKLASIIYKANRADIQIVHLIRPRQRLIMPNGIEDYVVQSGDTLWSIAQNICGDANLWQEIYKLNKGVINVQYKIMSPKLIIPQRNIGGGLPYNPGAWNDGITPGGIQGRTNCYAYALDFQGEVGYGARQGNRIPVVPGKRDSYTLQPGDLRNASDTRPDTQDALRKFDNAKLLGDPSGKALYGSKLDALANGHTFRDATPDEITGKKALGANEWLVYLVVDPAISGDYHWYRRNSDGTWSHKPGTSPVTDKALTGINVYYDPSSLRITREKLIYGTSSINDPRYISRKITEYYYFDNPGGSPTPHPSKPPEVVVNYDTEVGMYVVGY